MDDAPVTAAVQSGQTVQNFPVGVPVVDYQGQTHFQTEIDQVVEPFFLDLHRRQIPEKIQSYFTETDHPGMGGQGF